MHEGHPARHESKSRTAIISDHGVRFKLHAVASCSIRVPDSNTDLGRSRAVVSTWSLHARTQSLYHAARTGTHRGAPVLQAPRGAVPRRCDDVIARTKPKSAGLHYFSRDPGLSSRLTWHDFEKSPNPPSPHPTPLFCQALPGPPFLVRSEDAHRVARDPSFPPRDPRPKRRFGGVRGHPIWRDHIRHRAKCRRRACSYIE